MNKKILSGVVHEVPKDMEKALKTDTDILDRWNNLTPIQRNEWICWVTIVKKSEMREEHIYRMIEELKEGKRKPCCWPGCPHRRPSAQSGLKKLRSEKNISTQREIRKMKKEGKMLLKT